MPRMISNISMDNQLPAPRITEQAIDRLGELAFALDRAISTGDWEQIQVAQQALSEMVNAGWQQLDQETRPSRDKALGRLIAVSVDSELPMAVQDPANYPRIQRTLRLFRNSLALFKSMNSEGHSTRASESD